MILQKLPPPALLQVRQRSLCCTTNQLLHADMHLSALLLEGCIAASPELHTALSLYMDIERVESLVL